MGAQVVSPTAKKVVHMLSQLEGRATWGDIPSLEHRAILGPAVVPVRLWKIWGTHTSLADHWLTVCLNKTYSLSYTR